MSQSPNNFVPALVQTGAANRISHTIAIAAARFFSLV
jgi:hypothetical protein